MYKPFGLLTLGSILALNIGTLTLATEIETPKQTLKPIDSIDTTDITNTSLLKIKPLERSKAFTLGFQFNMFAINIEDSNLIWGDLTRGGVRGSFDLGYSLDAKNSLHAGGYLTQQLQFTYPRFNASLNTQGDLGLRLYYQYMNRYSEDSHFRAVFGIFPRDIMKPFNMSIFWPPFYFFNPNVTGFLLDSGTKYGYTQFYLDWYGGNIAAGTASKERFRVGLNSHYEFFNKLLIFDAEGLYHHIHDRDYLRVGVSDNTFAAANMPVANGPVDIAEQLYYRASIGSDVGRYIGLDRAYLGVGYSGSMERFRPVIPKYVPRGGLELAWQLRYKWLGYNGTYYEGTGQLLSYDQPGYRNALYQPIALFRADRLVVNDFYIVLKSSKYVTWRLDTVFEWWKGSFNQVVAALPGMNYTYHQLLNVRIDTRRFHF
ncbi:hypothetical protein BKH43_05030 [Helicobacter sp. 13S00401-1]|uniref:hypothetical protein n=1 Tax=Helicobacter sp. 13S00401-1 TaxID=1905758 RepID=UPI000BA69E56|nr:hypothetical protein [Helicobacter sp. 13S00401-1]PAF50267.1 hypothetical protein BKH43_05030 [Helicobacter sp. 13S00401-1]